MGLFRQIIDTLPSQTASLGQTVRFQLPRDFPREGFILKANVVVATGAATLAAERCFSLFKRIRLTANDGGQQRVLVDADSLAVMERSANYGLSVDSDTAVALISSTFAAATYTISIPFYYAPTILGTPTRDLFLQNFPRFNNDPVLEIQVGSQADVDVHATPTFALTSLSLSVVELKREVSIPNWQFLNTEFVTAQVAFPATVVDYRYQIPVPGYHTFVGMRPYASASSIAESIYTNPFRFQVLNTLQANIAAADLRRINERSILCNTSATAANTVCNSLLLSTRNFIDFLSTTTEEGIQNLDTLLNTNPFTQLGTGPEYRLDITGGAAVKIVFLHERIFGNVSGALMIPKISGKRS